MPFNPPRSLLLWLALLLLTGCASFQLRGDIQSGRQALLRGEPGLALSYFQRAARIDPHYVTDFTIFEEGVWTYVGRAHYDLGEFREARKALLRARSEYAEDPLGHLYLGMVLMQQGEVERGLKEARLGLNSLRDWMRDLDRYDSMGVYWDPGGVLEGQIEMLLSMMESRDVRWQRMVPGLEWLGREFEEESDRAKDDEQHDNEDEHEGMTS